MTEENIDNVTIRATKIVRSPQRREEYNKNTESTCIPKSEIKRYLNSDQQNRKINNKPKLNCIKKWMNYKR